ncbi:MAG: DUF4267 domain-containing protein [Hyphomicrobiaceae bacterium]|nr:DUF4267 domain-containing protein [Hyphomicrobiaceae bacterium]
MAQRGGQRLVDAVFWLAIATGVVLSLIGIRFLLQPEPAATFFGIDRRDPGFAPHAAIALRDLWLGLLVVAFAMLRDWCAVALWLGMATLVCFGDALIAATSSGRWVSVAFHSGSGLFCGALASMAWRLARRPSA